MKAPLHSHHLRQPEEARPEYDLVEYGHSAAYLFNLSYRNDGKPLVHVSERVGTVEYGLLELPFCKGQL